MLRHLCVTDFVLVHELQIEFNSGLTVITGESGAGKSILMGALSLVLGERADTNAVRPEAQRSSISAEFDIADNPQAVAFLSQRELTDTDDPTRCLLRRVISREGRSRAFINAAPVTLAELRRLSDMLINIHSQDENQILLKRNLQLQLLDDYGVSSELRTQVRQSYEDWQGALKDIATLESRINTSRDRAELLQYHLQELQQLDLKSGEYETLDIQQRRLARADDARQTIGNYLDQIEDDEGSRHFLLKLTSALDPLAEGEANLEAAKELLLNAVNCIDEAAVELRGYVESLSEDPEQLNELNRRIDQANELARKHRVRPGSLADHQAQMEAELENMEFDEAELERLHNQARQFEQQYRSAAERLSLERKTVAKDFCQEISAVMQHLGMAGGSLSVEFSPDESARGLESLDLLVVTNPKYSAALLSRVASGGERSRIALAIQVVAARKVALPTLVLDEADVGVGGKSSDIVGRMLRDLSGHTQVLCVTHAPQVAALGHHHLRVLKTADQTSTIEPMDDDNRIAELARMLGGQEITEKTRQYAEELIEAAG